MKPRKIPPPEETSAHARAELKSYFDSLAADARETMEALRGLIHAAAPGAIEVMHNGNPSFRIEGKLLVYYAAWRAHCGLHPVSPALRRAVGNEIEAHENSKGVLQFSYDHPLPTALITKLVKARLIEARRERH